MQNTKVAGGMLLEDHLKKVLSKGQPNASNPKRDPKQKRMMHSCFGDFPAGYITKKNDLVVETLPLTSAEQSAANKKNQVGKLRFHPAKASV